jgi:general secretion pathway protein H
MNRPSAGFTLFEMIVVLALFALISALSFPYINRSLHAGTLQSTSTQILNAMNTARATALSQGKAVRLEFDAGKRTLTADGVVVANVPLSIRSTVTGSKPSKSKERVEFLFTAEGNSSGGQIVLTEGQQSTRIAINWLTGATTLTRDP